MPTMGELARRLSVQHPAPTLLLTAPAMRPTWRAEARALLDDLARPMRRPDVRATYAALRATADADILALDTAAALAQWGGFGQRTYFAPPGSLSIIVLVAPSDRLCMSIPRTLGAMAWFGSPRTNAATLSIAPLSPPPHRA